jgi:transcriptional antiterminator RfaH
MGVSNMASDKAGMPRTGAKAAVGPDNWFAAQLKPNALRIATRNLDRQGYATFAPRMVVVHRHAGRVTRRTEPVFPGYVFVHLDPAGSGWRSINGTLGVTRLVVGDPRSPRPLPRDLMATLLQQCDGTDVFAPAAALAVGDRVEMTDGPFAALVGRIVALDRDGRIRVMMDILGGETPVSAIAAHMRRVG